MNAGFDFFPRTASTGIFSASSQTRFQQAFVGFGEFAVEPAVRPIGGEFVDLVANLGPLGGREPGQFGKDFGGAHDGSQLGAGGGFGKSGPEDGSAGRIFCLTETGETHVVAAGREFRVLHVNRLGEAALATPAVARDSVILRTLTKLHRLAQVVEITGP